MELQGKHVIPLSRPEVWAALNDADVLRACIPGCQALTKTAENRFTATVASKIGPVSAVFTGEVELSDIVPERSYTISGSGKGGVAGFAKGRSEIALADSPEGTVLSYTATAEIGGKLAQRRQPSAARCGAPYRRRFLHGFGEPAGADAPGRATGGTADPGTCRQPPSRAGDAGPPTCTASLSATTQAGAKRRLAVDPGCGGLADRGVPRRPSHALVTVKEEGR